MLKLNNDITSILKAYLKCDEISCNNYGTYVLIFRLHYKKKIYCKKCYNKKKRVFIFFLFCSHMIW